MKLTKQIDIAEGLARAWMPSFRQVPPGQPPRPAWEHPADLVRLLSERRGDYSEAEQLMAVAMAWTHDLIEDGVKPDGSRVTAGDLRAHPFDVRIIQGVIQLTNPHGVSKTRYYETLKNIDYLAKLVKCVDHICNLREGKDIFEPARWKQYVEETRTYIRPLAQTLRDETRDWLWLEMDRAMAARPVNA